MKGQDTLKSGPSTLLIRNQDLAEYMEHRQRISKIESVNKIGNGDHIHRIQDSGTFFREK
jgi:hypothetical protein